jgi:hypothetical protein
MNMRHDEYEIHIHDFNVCISLSLSKVEGNEALALVQPIQAFK